MLKIILILVAIISVSGYAFWTWKRQIKTPKKKLENLAQALELGLITEEELLRLKSDRAIEELKNYHDKKKKKK